MVARVAHFLKKVKVMVFQKHVHTWLMRCFGEPLTSSKTERNHRFLEESLELVQAAGMTRDEAHAALHYVYGRPAGEVSQEAGGVTVCLAALCQAHGLDMELAAQDELYRCIEKIEVIRSKQLLKPDFGRQ
jgi:hypothetical protein